MSSLFEKIFPALLLSTSLFSLEGTSLFQPTQPESTPLVSYKPYRFNLSHIESKGVGYNQGYSTLSGFFTLQANSFLSFLDMRAHVFNDGKWASNVGLGTRYLLDSSSYMVGVNGYYDYRKTKHLHYNQVGVGFEAFLHSWEFRTNGYLPVGDKSKTLSNTLTSVSFKTFSGHDILINEHYLKVNEASMRGFNAEVGVHPYHFHSNYDLFLGASGYYFNADNGQTTWGGKLRAKAQISSYFLIELSDSYDHVFHNRFQGSVALRISLGKKQEDYQHAKFFLRSRALLPVERQEIIVVHKRKMHHTIDPIAINPATGQPFFVIFVRNTNTHPNPNGTFENPFPNLTPADGIHNAQSSSNPGDVIYVFPGSSSEVTQIGMNHGFSFQDDQRFLGSGISNQFFTTKGLLTIPPQTAIAPSISNHNSMVMSLAENNEISGTHLYALGVAAAECIGVGSPMINNATITRNLLSGNPASSSSRGISVISSMTGTVHIDQNTIDSQGSNGVNLVPNTGPALILLTRNTVSNTNASGLFVKTSNLTDPITTLLVNENKVTNALGVLSSGIDIQGNRNITATVTNNSCTANGENGIFLFFAASANILCDVRHNRADNNQNSGIFLIAPVRGCVRFNHNSAAGNSLHSFFWTQNSPAPGCRIELPTGNSGIIDTDALTVQLVPADTCNFGPN